MIDQSRPIWADVQPWLPLTEISNQKRHASANVAANHSQTGQGLPNVRPPPAGTDPALTRLFFDIVTYPYSDISSRIKRLAMSARVFESAKRGGLEQGLLLESCAGQTLYLIPQKQLFSLFGMEDPYERAVSVEHAFYVNGLCYLLKQDPRFRSVVAEAKIGKGSATGDVITAAQDGHREAWEMTLSTGNLLAQAAKYVATDIVKTTFVCRNHKLSVAVQACCREAGLDPQLLSRLDYTHWSALLRRQRGLYRY